MGSHCSPRLDTSRYLFNTDISFLEKNHRRDIWYELNFRNRHLEQNWWGGSTQTMRGEKCIVSEAPQVGKLKQLNFLTFREHKNSQKKRQGEDNKNKHYFTPLLVFCSCKVVIIYMGCMIKTKNTHGARRSLHIHKYFSVSKQLRRRGLQAVQAKFMTYPQSPLQF